MILNLTKCLLLHYIVFLDILEISPKMSDFDENFMEMTSYWAPPSSPSPRTILAMLDQTDDGLNPIAEIFPQTNLPRDHIEQSELRSGLGERLAARIGFNLPTLDTENISPLTEIFRSSTVNPSPVVAISPGFSPSALLQSPNMVIDSSHVSSNIMSFVFNTIK